MQGANESPFAIGLSSGTSMDGIDAVLVAFDDDSGNPITVHTFRTFPYDAELSDTLREATEGGPVDRLALLDVIVGEAFAAAALELLAAASVSPQEVRCIGSHGQTIVHLPEPESCAGAFARASLQIGDPSVIAERTGITTVADFRARDLAAGGQGAPLAPFLDYRLYADAERGRVALNLGGIANVTGLPAGADIGGTIAFDTGPGNVLLDAAARLREIPDGFDEGGAVAADGRVDEALLESLLEHPYYERKPPKSADTVEFLNDTSRALLQDAAALSDADLLATLAELTARTVADGIERFIAVRQSVDDIVISGGGAHNRTLCRRIGERVAPAELVPAEEVAAIPGDAKEAVLFALMARETLAGRPSNVDSATGAAGPRVLGVIVPGV